jgi:hypothetical protein
VARCRCPEHREHTVAFARIGDSIDVHRSHPSVTEMLSTPPLPRHGTTKRPSHRSAGIGRFLLLVLPGWAATGNGPQRTLSSLTVATLTRRAACRGSSQPSGRHPGQPLATHSQDGPPLLHRIPTSFRILTLLTGSFTYILPPGNQIEKGRKSHPEPF